MQNGRERKERNLRAASLPPPNTRKVPFNKTLAFLYDTFVVVTIVIVAVKSNINLSLGVP